MDDRKHIIYFDGPSCALQHRLSIHFEHQYEVLHREHAMLFEVIENKSLLAVLVDLNQVDHSIPPGVLAKQSDIPVIGLSENHLIQPSWSYLTDIAHLTDDPLSQFDDLEKHLLKHKRSRFGDNRGQQFRNYIIKQHTQQPEFLSSIQSVYQPIYNLRNTQYDRFEVLMRWPNAPFKDFKINELFSAMNEEPLIDEMTLQQIQEIAAFVSELHQKTGKYFQAFINLSSQQFNNPLVVQEIAQILNIYKLPPNVLCFEIHPAEFDDDSGIWKENLQDIHQMSANVSLKIAKNTEFSASDLEQYHIRSMKLQHDLLTDADPAKVERLIQDAQKLNIQLIAEQVETAQDVDFINKKPIEFAQGYYFSKPLSSQQLAEMMK